MLDNSPTATATAPPVRSAPRRMTYEEFLEWADEDTLAEWVDGEVILMAPASNKHQDICDFLTALLRHFTEGHQLGVVRSAPFQMKTGPDLSGREPDVVFVAREHLDRLKETYLDGPADLAIEIVSTQSRYRDREAKFEEYQRGGVREYWLIDPIRQQAEFYYLRENQRYRLADIGEDGVFRSEVLPGLWLKVEWLWQEPLPLLREVLGQWEVL